MACSEDHERADRRPEDGEMTDQLMVDKKEAAPRASADLSKEIALVLERKPDERLRVIRLFGDYYRCNWWVQDSGPHPLWFTTGTIRKSRFVRAHMAGDQLKIEGGT